MLRLSTPHEVQQGQSPAGNSFAGKTSAQAVARNASTIEGAPCRPIETAVDVRSTFDELLSEGGRRPTNPTVPFPRPRVASRGVTTPSPDDSQDIGRNWHGTTTRTLRFVLTSPDHKPQRVAAVLVCLAAALVIFAIGRSPISGTASIGQATESLSAERGAAAKGAPMDPVLADPGNSPAGNARSNAGGTEPGASELAATSGSDSPGDTGASDVVPPREPSAAGGQELAPGLVLPAAEASSGATASGNADAAAPSVQKAPRPAATPAPSIKPPPRKSPAPQPSLQPPPRKPSGELDFGI